MLIEKVIYIRLPFDAYKLILRQIFARLITYLTAMRQRGRFAGFSLYVSNTTNIIPSGVLCYKDGPEIPPLDFNINCTKNGRYIIFYNERKDGITYPVDYETLSVFTELCEVYVLGML